MVSWVWFDCKEGGNWSVRCGFTVRRKAIGQSEGFTVRREAIGQSGKALL